MYHKMEEINRFIAAGLPPDLPFLAAHYLLTVQVLPVEKLIQVNLNI
jgi:hypothetical protein